MPTCCITSIGKSCQPQHRDELLPENLDLAAFLVVHTLEALTHGIITDHPERLGDPALAEEVSNVVVRYLSGGTRARAVARGAGVAR